jgi:hypothetical protein
MSGRYGERSARWPLARTRPASTAVDQSSRPAARSSHVSGSVSTTFGGVPRVCRGPGTHWIAANGGTRTSTVRPGTCCSSSPRLYRTAARRAGRSGSDPIASASVTAASVAAPSTRSVASPGHGGWPSAARCSFRAASSLVRSGPRGGTAKQASGPYRLPAAPADLGDCLPLPLTWATARGPGRLPAAGPHRGRELRIENSCGFSGHLAPSRS